VLLIAFLLPIGQLGIYSLAVSLAELLWYLPQAISTVLMPHVARSSETELKFLTPVFCRTTLGLTTLCAIGLAIVATWVIPIFLPAFLPSIRILWILTPGIVLASIFKVISSDFNGRGNPLRVFYPAAGVLVFELLACFRFIPRYGIEAAAAVTSGAYVMNAILYLYSYARLTSVPVKNLIFLRRTDAAKIFQGFHRHFANTFNR
jgi:O-antigen/teichoic acid export membrane protein